MLGKKRCKGVAENSCNNPRWSTTYRYLQWNINLEPRRRPVFNPRERSTSATARSPARHRRGRDKLPTANAALIPRYA
eukprot:scaffold71014_cov64-Phaeocystis_antarctica.AAC.6